MRSQGYCPRPPSPVGTLGQTLPCAVYLFSWYTTFGQTLPCAVYLFSWYKTGLGYDDSTPLAGSCCVGDEVLEGSQVQNTGPSQTLSETPGAYGVLCHGQTVGTDAYETASFSSSELGMAPRHTLCEHHSAVSSYFQSLGGHLFSTGRSALGTGVQVHRCYNRYFRNRLGRCVHWACGLLGLDKPSTALSYNFP